MTFDELKDKALSLPLSPGVYVMRDKEDRVIYVGKAKRLKNRVTQYFQDALSHTPKTRMMVSKIDHFDVIVAASEFEALVLECSLIKRYLPKYNILLKDGKGYPYLRLNMKDAYPMITMVSKPVNDGAEYFGPYGSRGVTQSLIKTIHSEKIQVFCLHRHFIDSAEGACIGFKLCAVTCSNSLQSVLRNPVCFKIQNGNSVRFQKRTVHNTLQQNAFSSQILPIQICVIQDGKFELPEDTDCLPQAFAQYRFQRRLPMHDNPPNLPVRFSGIPPGQDD